MIFCLLIVFSLVGLAACSAQVQNQPSGATTTHPSDTTGQASEPKDPSVKPVQPKAFALDMCTTFGKVACEMMSKIYPEQPPTCSAYREANGRLVETCGYPTPPATSPAPSRSLP